MLQQAVQCNTLHMRHPDHIMSSDSCVQTEQFVAVNPEVCDSYCDQAFLRWVKDPEFDTTGSGNIYEGMLVGVGWEEGVLTEVPGGVEVDVV